MYFTAKTLMQIMPARVIRKNKREGKVQMLCQSTFPDPETAHSTAPLIKNTFLKRIVINIMATLKKMTGNASNSASDKGKSS